ncbi:FBA_3 domain-containing protein [Cephalotus follicularis]|uniref:FBA_3 domain-containing protein n=1 Tax=Cephalotus follicularis TaxID=3775 RepID=A0A1Q3C768_CEPFO|nr:FBA_3 domain-containing protein [Cephalotus follicularis]
MYTLGYESWREISHVPCIPIGMHIDCKGTLFWLLKMQTLQTLQTFHNKGTIMSFDIDSEEFHVLNGPRTIIPLIGVSYFRPYLINVYDTIALVLECLRGYEIWVLKDKENDIWIKEYILNYPGINGRFRLFATSTVKYEKLSFLVYGDEMEDKRFFAPSITKYEKFSFLFYRDETKDKRRGIKFARPIVSVPHIVSLVSPLSFVNTAKRFSICEAI